MSDLSATQCGCGSCRGGLFGGFGCGGNNSCIWIIILLLCCGGTDFLGGSGCDCIWIILLLLCCCKKDTPMCGCGMDSCC